MGQLMPVASIVLIALLLGVPAARAQHDTEKEHAELVKALPEGKVSLQSGLNASAREGKPISGKYEVDDGKLQLSVYTAKGDKFSEVIVDHGTGKVAKAEAITKPDDLTAAKSQSEAMAKSKRSLNAAVADALKANTGFRAVSVYPAMKDGHPVADVTIVKGTEWKTLSEKLD
jgi:hypothetical protein